MDRRIGIPVHGGYLMDGYAGNALESVGTGLCRILVHAAADRRFRRICAENTAFGTDLIRKVNKKRRKR